MEAVQRTTADLLLDMDFIGSLTGNRLAFRLLQSPESVEIDEINYQVTRDTWGFSDPDTRSFEVRLMDCFKFTSNLLYQEVKVVASQADRTHLRLPKKLFPDAAVSQELPWSAWLLADAASQAVKETDDQKTHANILPEREQTLVDALLLRFRNIAELAPVPEGDEVKEITAAQTFQLKVETAGLIRAAEDLMSLSRELKEMWLFGPLRSLNEGEASANAMIDDDARAVAAILDSIMRNGDGEQKATVGSSTKAIPSDATEDQPQVGEESGDDRDA